MGAIFSKKNPQMDPQRFGGLFVKKRKFSQKNRYPTIGGLKPAEHKYSYEKFLRSRIEYIRVFWRKEHEWINEKYILCSTEGPHVDHQEYFNFAR